MNTNISGTFALSPNIPDTSPALTGIGGVTCTFGFVPAAPTGGSLSASLQTPGPFNGGGSYANVLPAVAAYRANPPAPAPQGRIMFNMPDASNLWEQSPEALLGPVGLSGGQASYDESTLTCTVTIAFSASAMVASPFMTYGGSVSASFSIPFATTSVDIVATDWTWQTGPGGGIISTVTLSVSVDGAERTIVAG